MRKTLFRLSVVGTALAVVGVSVAGVAIASKGHSKFGTRAAASAHSSGAQGGFRFGGNGGGPGFGGHGPGGGGGLVGVDVLGPSATFLGISASTLEADLKGGKTLAQEATAKGKTAADLITALTNNEKSILDGEVAAGWLTADQETSRLTALTATITSLVNNGPVAPNGAAQQGGSGNGGQGSGGPGNGGPGNGGGFGFGGGFGGPGGFQGPLQAASTYLGISVSDLLTDLKGGKTLATVIGTVSGKSVSGLITAVEAPMKTRLDAQVTAGKLTQAQEDSFLAKLTTGLTDFINGTKPAGGGSTMGHVMGFRHG